MKPTLSKVGQSTNVDGSLLRRETVVTVDENCREMSKPSETVGKPLMNRRLFLQKLHSLRVFWSKSKVNRR